MESDNCLVITKTILTDYVLLINTKIWVIIVCNKVKPEHNTTAAKSLDQLTDRIHKELENITLKKDIHPSNYRPVVFQDLSNGTTFVTKSTAKSDETLKVDGVEYPLIKVHISSATHPFFTGQEKLLDMEGRVDKFKARSEAAAKAREAKLAAGKKAAKVRKDEATKLGK